MTETNPLTSIMKDAVIVDGATTRSSSEEEESGGLTSHSDYTVEEALHFVHEWEDAVIADTAACTAALNAAGSTPGMFALRRGDVCRVLCVVSHEGKVCHFRLQENDQGVILSDTSPPYTGEPFPDLRSCLGFYLSHEISMKTPNLMRCVPYVPPALPPFRQESSGLGTSTPQRPTTSNLLGHVASPVRTMVNTAVTQGTDSRSRTNSLRQNSASSGTASLNADTTMGGEGDSRPTSVGHNGIDPGRSVSAASSASSDSATSVPTPGTSAVATSAPRVPNSVPGGVAPDQRQPSGTAQPGFLSQVGARVNVTGYPVAGTIRFLGLCPSVPPFYVGYRCGVELDQPFGKNDGNVQGYQFFVCRPQHGLLVVPDKVVLQNTGLPVRVPRSTTNGGSAATRARTESAASARARSAPTTPNAKTSRPRTKSNAQSRGTPVVTAPPLRADSSDDAVSLVDDGDEEGGDSLDVQQSLFIVMEGDVQIHLEGKKGWKAYHAVFDVCGKLKYFGKKRSAEVDIAQYGESIDIGPLAFNAKGGTWPRRSNPTCCFLVRMHGAKTLYFITATEADAIQWCSALRKFKPQMRINAVPGTMPKELLDEEGSDDTAPPARTSSMVNVEQDLDQSFGALDGNSAAMGRVGEDDRRQSAPPTVHNGASAEARTIPSRDCGDVTVQDVGALVQCSVRADKPSPGKLFGILRFYGPRKQGDETVICGVELFEPCGNCDGSSEGQRYFNCEPCMGLVLNADDVQVLPPGTVKPAVEWVRLLETDESTDIAIGKIRKAIVNKDPYAALVLGKLYEKGKFISKNLDLASVNFQKAADYGSSNGMYCLAMKLLNEATGFSGQFGVKYLDTAALAGNAMARLALAGCCFTGKGNKKGVKNDGKGLTVLQNAAMQGFPEAQFQMGQLHNFGLFTVPVNKALAAQWLNVAAAQGHKEAAIALQEIQTSSTA